MSGHDASFANSPQASDRVAVERDFALAVGNRANERSSALTGRLRMDAQIATKSEQAGAELKGSSLLAAIKQSGVEFVLAVPDIHTSKGLLFPIADDPALRLVRVCKEDECVGIASGLHYSDRRALILIQYTGFLDSLNAIRAVAVEYKQPICMMVGLLGHEPERPPAESKRYGVRIIEPICDAMGIPHHVISQDSDLAKIKPAIDKAYADSFPVALLIGRRPS
jgi:sulfopyruvate decarboxylase subunit alpha